jgi:hypothetical protein
LFTPRTAAEKLPGLVLVSVPTMAVALEAVLGLDPATAVRPVAVTPVVAPLAVTPVAPEALTPVPVPPLATTPIPLALVA